MGNVQVLTTFGSQRATLVGMLGADPLLKWNDSGSPTATWRAARVPIAGGDPVLLPGQPGSGQVSPVGAHDGFTACGHALPFQIPSGLILTADGRRIDLEAVWAVVNDKKLPRAVYLSHTTADGVYGRLGGGQFGCWGWDGHLIATSPVPYPHPLQAVAVPTPEGYTSFNVQAVSPDRRYVAGVGVNLAAPTVSDRQKRLMVDTWGGAVVLLTDVLGCDALPAGLQFLPDGSVVCVAQTTPSTQSLVRVTGWEAPL